MHSTAFDKPFSTDRRRRALSEGGPRRDRRLGTGRLVRPCAATFVLTILVLSGCTSVRDWWHNGLKVGPNYSPPCAPVESQWIDHEQPEIRSEPARYSAWWAVFGDPVLNQLVDSAYGENLPLKVAAFRIVEARAQRGIATGNFFAQLQEMTAKYSRSTSSGTTRFGGIGSFPKSYFQRWEVGFDAAWELDFWGRFRRQVEASDADLHAEIANYDDVLVILQAEVAATYVEIRTLQERLEQAEKSVSIQEDTLEIAEAREEAGKGQLLDVEQAKADLAVTKAAIPLLETSYRQAQNNLCVLLGMPPQDLQEILGDGGSIPAVPTRAEIVVGIPAELLRRRPDIRRAEREVAAQCARIGVATSDLYPHITITGTIGVESLELRRLFGLHSIAGSIGPGIRWDILNYGRILNNVRGEDARFQQSVLNYQETVLQAYREVENAIVAYLEDRKRIEPLENAVTASRNAYDLSLIRRDLVDFQRILDSQRVLVQQQDRLAEGRGNVGLRLIALYKALGGGWQIRYRPQGMEVAPAEVPGEIIPAPVPENPKSANHDLLHLQVNPADVSAPSPETELPHPP